MKRGITILCFMCITFFAGAKNDACVRSYAHNVNYIQARYDAALASCTIGVVMNWFGSDPFGAIADMDCENQATWDYKYSLDLAGGQFLACLGVS